MTFYGARDNCPPGAQIAHPVIHQEAGGLGTYDDPITFASVTNAFPVGTRVYIPRLKKYFIMEDDCSECKTDWNKNKKYHIDCWMGPPTLTSGTELIACENALTDNDNIIVDPANNYPVDTTSLFDGTTQQCIVAAPPCHDKGKKCGNKCKLPVSASCADLANQYHLTLQRFKELNPHFDCRKNIRKGKFVCQGGTCGD